MKALDKSILRGVRVVALCLPLATLVEPALGEESRPGSSELPMFIESESLDLLTLNIAHARGTSLNQLLVSADGHRQNLEIIASLILESDVDVVALQEADGPSLWSGRFDHVGLLAKKTGFTEVIHGYHADSWLFQYGAALISGVSMSDTRSHGFQPSWPTAGKGFVMGTVQWRDPGDLAATRRVTLVSVHLDFSRESVRQSQITEVIEALAPIENPLIVMGDFNADWSDVDSPPRLLARALELRAFEPDNPGLGTYKDRERLDWILISPQLRFVEYTVLPNIVSDHLPVLTRVGWKQTKEAEDDD